MNSVSHVNIERALALGGWMSEQELTWLAEQASKCKTIVEFGSFHGRSTRALADNIQSDGKIWAVDPWNGDYVAEDGDVLSQVQTFCLPYFLKNLEDHIKVGRVIPIRNFSSNFELPHTVDMVFIDGDHRYKTVVKDIEKAVKLVGFNTDGIISGHDYGHPLWTGVKQAVDEFFTDVKVVGSIWWTQKF